MRDTYQGVRVCGPLASHADGFYWWLVDRRFYSRLTAVDHLRLVAHVSRWLASRDLNCAALTGDLALEFVAARRAAGYHNLRSPRALAPLLAYSGGRGRTEPTSAATPADLLQSYRCYLTVERRLVVGSVDNRAGCARFRLLRAAGRYGSGRGEGRSAQRLCPERACPPSQRVSAARRHPASCTAALRTAARTHERRPGDGRPEGSQQTRRGSAASVGTSGRHAAAGQL